MKCNITFISAGAGSGKTHRLTEILFEKLTSGGVAPAGVLATTFTVRAATELRERVRSSLLKRGKDELANRMGQARIGTVNSVCGALLERFAFEAGVSPQLRVLEEGPATTLLAKAVDSTLTSEHTRDFYDVLSRFWLWKDEQWKVDLRTLVNQARANAIAPDTLRALGSSNAKELLARFPDPVDRDLTGELIAAIDKLEPQIVERLEESGRKNTRDYLDLLRRIRQEAARNRTPWSDWAKLSKSAPEKALVPVVEPIQDIVVNYARHPQLHADIRLLLEVMFDLAASALSAYDSIKREQGLIDFVDQEHHALTLLDDPTVQAALREELQLLLVDEFQDTSPIQLGLFLKLSELAQATFWVGDIKQCVYEFRGSDTRLMGSILEWLKEIKASKEILPKSWRSRPVLVNLVNGVFTPAFQETLPKEEVELAPTRPELKGTPALANWVLNGANLGEQISALAGGIRGLVESGCVVVDKETEQQRAIRYSDVAILCRSNERVVQVGRGLLAQDVLSETAQPGLLALPETVLALACLRRLSDPSDTIASAEVVSLIDCEKPEEWLAHRFRHLASNGEADRWREAGDDAHSVLARLAGLRPDFFLWSPKEALLKAVACSDLPRAVLQWQPDAAGGRRRLANLQALLAMAEQYEDVCRSLRQSGTVAGLLLWLQDRAASKLDHMAPTGVDAVKVMTYHGAKGLEWPVVVLMDLDALVKDRLWGISARSSGKLNAAQPLKNRQIRYWPWPFGLQRSLQLRDDISASEVGQEFEAAAVEEAKRLLYVAMTRARDMLVLAQSSRAKTLPTLDTLNAPWLLAPEERRQLQLPDGTKVPCECAQLAPVEPRRSKRSSRPVRWFVQIPVSQTKLPKFVLPSLAGDASGTVVETAAVGEGLILQGRVEPTALGTALHACIAASAARELAVADFSEILERMGVRKIIAGEVLHRQVGTLFEWLRARWPGAIAHVEVPIESVLPTGQTLKGQIDLLLELPDRWVLVDHKSTRAKGGDWSSVASEYAGQLQAYSEAVQKATSKPVSEHWLYSPLAGQAVRVEIRELAPTKKAA
jgi:ATP-dependent helicase/nuclease subunit A